MTFWASKKGDEVSEYCEKYIENEFKWVFFPIWWTRVTGWVFVADWCPAVHDSKAQAQGEIDSFIRRLKDNQDKESFHKNKTYSYEDYPDD